MRASSISSLMIALYYLAPLDRQPDARAALWLAVGLVALVVAVVYQAGAIAGSETPRHSNGRVAGSAASRCHGIRPDVL